MALKGSNDNCMRNTADDEPVFTLCARDITAPQAVRDWASRVRSSYMSVGRGLPVAVVAKLDEAEECATAMEAWQRKNGCKLPD